MAVMIGFDEAGAQVRVETGRGVVLSVQGLGTPRTGDLHRNYRVTIRPTHSTGMRFPVTALTTAGAATLDAAFDALAHGGEVGYEVQVRRIAGVDTAVPLDVLRATADSARASVRRILVALGSTISSEALALSASRPARRCA
ncbi:MAG TPA: hypothetical protein VHB18_15965 [Mycobacteriales bacterium]|jgi:hypothetical protein|nr:hypothetical protein [Mycobacteriales bacterium]